MGAARNKKNGRFSKQKVVEKFEAASVRTAAVNKRRKLAATTSKPEPISSMGRRLVDLSLLANSLWCDFCNDQPLSLSSIEEEQQRGLASVFQVRCPRCLELKLVPTSTCEEAEKFPLYTVNCKAAIGCLDSGIGHEQLNKFLSVLNVPVIQRTTMKRAERRMGPYLTAVAQDSCRKAIEEEKQLTVAERNQLTT